MGEAVCLSVVSLTCDTSTTFESLSMSADLNVHVAAPYWGIFNLVGDILASPYSAELSYSCFCHGISGSFIKPRV